MTTFIPNTLTSSDSDEDGFDEEEVEDPFSDRETHLDRHPTQDEAERFIPSYDFDLRDPHERTFDDHRFVANQDYSADSNDQTLTARDAMEGDVITVSHSHATSINNSRLHSRAPSQHGSAPSTPHRERHHSSIFPQSLSSSWPSLALPPSAVKLHRRRRNIFLRLLKTWEGREQVLQLTHSLVLILYSTLDHPVPRSYSQAMLRPAGSVMAVTFPKPVRVALMQRIYTAAEGIDNFRRVILIARWITSATETVMEHAQQRQARAREKKALQSQTSMSPEEIEIKLTGDEPLDKPSDHVESGFSWLQTPNLAPFEVSRGEDGGKDADKAEQSFSQAPAAKLGKLTGRGDASGAVGANVAEDADTEKTSGGKEPKAAAPPSSPSSPLVRTITRFCSNLFRLTHLTTAAESLATAAKHAKSPLSWLVVACSGALSASNVLAFLSSLDVEGRVSNDLVLCSRCVRFC